MNDSDHSPRLRPPPRIPAAAGDPTATNRREAVRRSRLSRNIGFATLFAALILATVGVFVVLPRWQAQRHDPSAAKSRDHGSAAHDYSPMQPTETQPSAPAPVRPEPTPTNVSPPPPLEIRLPTPTGAPHRYVEAMSEGLEALDQGRWEAARSALERAAGIRPGAPEVIDGLARVEAGQRREVLIHGTHRALELERAEAWREAEKTYLAVLAVDPESAEALDGHDRAAARADLDDKLEYHLQNPGRLSSPAVFEDSAAILEEARAVSPGGPRLWAQMSRLEELLETASRPVRVLIESDGLTEIVIYRVGKLGTFLRRELNLRPGTYTAVGGRPGFRDARVRFEVTPGSSQKPVVVQCTDRL